jgi:hypothetical protein
MDEVNQHELNWRAYVWRGTLGGVIGNVILELLGTMYLVVRFGANYLHDVVFNRSAWASRSSAMLYGFPNSWSYFY